MDVLKEAAAKADAGDFAGAAQLLDAADEATRATGLWAFARGTVEFRQGNVAAAVKWFEAALEREPLLPEPGANLGAALLELARAGDREALVRATAVLTEACALKPKLPDAHTNLGMARLLAGDAPGALEAFEHALRLDPRHVPALYDKAAALSALGRHQECLAALDATLAVDPSFAPARESRRNTLKRLGREP